MLIIFDKDTDKERRINFDFFNENIFRGTLNLGWNRKLDGASTVPAVAAMREDAAFEAIEIYDADEEGKLFRIPTQGRYNVVKDAAVNYSSGQRIYSASMVLGYEQREEPAAEEAEAAEDTEA